MVHIEKGKVDILGSIEEVLTDLAFGMSNVLKIADKQIGKEMVEILFKIFTEVVAEEVEIDIEKAMSRHNDSMEEAMAQAMEMIKKGEKNYG